jgi:hypothetical protein
MAQCTKGVNAFIIRTVKFVVYFNPNFRNFEFIIIIIKDVYSPYNSVVARPVRLEEVVVATTAVPQFVRMTIRIF